MDNANRRSYKVGFQYGAAKALATTRLFIRRRINSIRLMRSVARERRALARLSDRDLRDIGIHRADAKVEILRSRFDMPECRRQPRC